MNAKRIDLSARGRCTSGGPDGLALCAAVLVSCGLDIAKSRIARARPTGTCILPPITAPEENWEYNRPLACLRHPTRRGHGSSIGISEVPVTRGEPQATKAASSPREIRLDRIR